MPAAPTSALLSALYDLPPGPVCVGLSGGLDSTVLLHALAELERRPVLRALHVHHGLHPDADAWAGHCARWCASLGITCSVVHVSVARDSGHGPEGAARAARHAAFDAQLAPGEVLALGHHRDDQAETFLLRALRASGPDGLAAMRRWRDAGAYRIWRPWLDTARADLQAYAQAHGLAWIEDPSNADVAFDRNFLRQRVLPLLRERWPHADAALARSAALCADAGDLLGEDDAVALASVATLDPHVLSAPGLLALPAPRRPRVVRRWIAALGLPPLPAQGLRHLDSDLLDAARDGQPQFAWSGAVLTRWRDLLHADWQRPPLPAGWQHDWDGQTPLALPDGGTLGLLGAHALPSACRVHARAGGERIALPGRGHSHTVKHLLQRLGVPPWERAHLPLLSAAGGQVLAVGDVAYSAEFDAWLRAHGARLQWNRAGADGRDR